MRKALLLFLLLTACGCMEAPMTTSDADALVRKTIAEAKGTERVQIQVRLERMELPSPEELKVRAEIEKAIEDQRLGRVLEAGAAEGSYDVIVEVDSTAEAVPKIREVLRAKGVLERSIVRVVEERR